MISDIDNVIFLFQIMPCKYKYFINIYFIYLLHKFRRGADFQNSEYCIQ